MILNRLKTKPQKTCRTCKHRYKHEYGEMFYCNKKKSNRTAYGHAKIKASDEACILYQKKQK